MILFRLISWPYVRKHAVRSALTIAGIVIGVAVFVAMRAANESVFGSFQNTLQRVAGATELQVTAGATGFEEEVLERVQALPAIAVAAPVVEAVAATGIPGQGNVLMLGIDMTGDRSLREYDIESGDAAVIDDPLVFLAQPDSLMVTADFARRNGLATGRPRAARHRRGTQGLRRARRAEERRPEQRVRRQHRGHGHLRGAARLRPRAAIRSDRHRADAGRRAAGRRQEALRTRARARLPGADSGVERTELPVAAAHLPADAALLERRGAPHRDVHHLQLVRRCRDRAPQGDRHPARAWRVAAAGRAALRRRERDRRARRIRARRAGGLRAGGRRGRTRRRRFFEEYSAIDQGAISVADRRRLVALAIATGTITSVVAAAWPARNAATVDPIKALQKGRAAGAVRREAAALGCSSPASRPRRESC